MGEASGWLHLACALTHRAHCSPICPETSRGVYLMAGTYWLGHRPPFMPERALVSRRISPVALVRGTCSRLPPGCRRGRTRGADCVRARCRPRSRLWWQAALPAHRVRDEARSQEDDELAGYHRQTICTVPHGIFFHLCAHRTTPATAVRDALRPSWSTMWLTTTSSMELPASRRTRETKSGTSSIPASVIPGLLLTKAKLAAPGCRVFSSFAPIGPP
jgi:hypothetical protein